MALFLSIQKPPENMYGSEKVKSLECKPLHRSGVYYNEETRKLAEEAIHKAHTEKIQTAKQHIKEAFGKNVV